MTVLAAACLIVFIDQITKRLVYRSLLPGESLIVINPVFRITLVLNSGAAFGLFQRGGGFFIALGAAAVFVILVILLKNAKGRRAAPLVQKLGLAFILGGAAGNLIDRFRFGYVVDFLDFRIWPVFNLADSCITIGCILLVLGFTLFKPKPNNPITQ